ncbi:MAG TPA: amino acid adenylation domain-containing protein, partial [Bryobacteraceae bacterium]|nr:amino acid adenylation domain-containing protein [Bryobacteraceae bacterium]
GCRQGDRVALLMPKSIEALIGMFGTIKAGCMYVPLDTSSPAARLSRILQQCESRVVLAVDSAAALLRKLREAGAIPESTSIGWMDAPPQADGSCFTRTDLESLPTSPIGCEITATDPVHILFTSGSTGIPKGVVITHANVVHFVEWAVRYFGMEASDRLSCHPPLHFDLSMFDIYGSVAVGAELHLLAPELSLLPHRLAAYIRDARLTQWFSVPSILNYMAKLDVVRQDDFPALKRLLWCGEKFPTPGLIYWMRRLPRVTFDNLYGPTEATIASSFYRVPQCPEDETAEIPIGTACEGEQLLVLDERLQPTPPGETGNLYIGGVGLSPGYWRDPEKTEAAFLPNPFDASDRIYKTGDLAKTGEDGLIYLLGRADTQIKSRGYRIELGEIEAAVHAIPGIQSAAVVAVETPGFEGASICCAFVPEAASPISAAELKRLMAGILPHYMLPSSWMVLERMPLNGNGKADRPLLKERFHSQAVSVVAAD